MSDEHEHEQHPHAFGIVGPPPEVIAGLLAQHDRAHAQADADEARALRWLDGLDVEGLLALRYVLRCRPENAAANAAHYDGQAVALLRVRHGVDPETGRSVEELLREAAGGEPS